MLFFNNNKKQYESKFKVSVDDVIKANEVMMGLRPPTVVPEKYEELYNKVKCDFTYEELEELLEKIRVKNAKKI